MAVWHAQERAKNLQAGVPEPASSPYRSRQQTHPRCSNQSAEKTPAGKVRGARSHGFPSGRKDWSSSSRFISRPLAKYYIDHDQHGTDGHGRVRNIEGGPGIENMPGEKRKPNLQKICDRPVHDAIGDVAGGPGQQQCQSRCAAGAQMAACHQQPGDDPDNQHGAQNQQIARRPRRGIRKKTERDSRVPRKDDCNEIRNDLVRKIVRRAGFDPCFGRAV